MSAPPPNKCTARLATSYAKRFRTLLTKFAATNPLVEHIETVRDEVDRIYDDLERMMVDEVSETDTQTNAGSLT